MGCSFGIRKRLITLFAIYFPTSSTKVIFYNEEGTTLPEVKKKRKEKKLEIIEEIDNKIKKIELITKIQNLK